MMTQKFVFFNFLDHSDPRVALRAPRLTKRLPKSSILSLFGTLGHTFAPEPPFSSTLHFKNGIHGLIFLDVYNVTGCFHVFCCKDVLLIPSLSQDLPRQCEPRRRGDYPRWGREGDKSPSQVRRSVGRQEVWKRDVRTPSKRLAHGTWAGGF